MNRVALFILVGISVLSLGCRETISLEPVSYPQFLRGEVEFVKCFDDGGFMVMGFNRLFVKIDEQTEYTIENEDFSNAWLQIPFMKLYKHSNKIYGVSDNWVMSINDDGVEFEGNSLRSVFSQTNLYSDYAINSDGDLYAVNFGSVSTDSNFNNRYQLYISEWNNDGYWSEYPTEIRVSDSSLVTPSMTFGGALMYVSLKNIYEIELRSDNSIRHDKIVISPQYQTTNITNLHYSNGIIYGDDYDPGNGAFTFSIDLNTGINRNNLLADVCGEANQFGYFGELFQISNGQYYYFEDDSNWDAEVNDGDLRVLYHKQGTCESIEVEIESFEYRIVDISFQRITNKLFLATTSGLKTYDLATELIEDYLSSSPEE